MAKILLVASLTFKDCIRSKALYGVFFFGVLLFLLNITDHIRAGERQAVTEWHTDLLTSLGWNVWQEIEMHSPGQRDGQNRDVRVPTEVIIVFEGWHLR